MEKHQSRITILICLAVSVAIVLFWFNDRSRSQVGVPAVPSPARVPEAQALQLSTVGSSDGKMSLIMKQKKGEGTITYTFLITDEETNSQKEIFFKTVAAGTTISVPDNTFSSDNKYAFLKENGIGAANYFILTTSGEPVYKDNQSFDFSSMFNEKYQDYMITDATGWAGPTLVVINTDKKEGGTGPSFWFDVASKSFIQLSNRFD